MSLGFPLYAILEVWPRRIHVLLSWPMSIPVLLCILKRLSMLETEISRLHRLGRLLCVELSTCIECGPWLSKWLCTPIIRSFGVGAIVCETLLTISSLLKKWEYSTTSPTMSTMCARVIVYLGFDVTVLILVHVDDCWNFDCTGLRDHPRVLRYLFPLLCEDFGRNFRPSFLIEYSISQFHVFSINPSCFSPAIMNVEGAFHRAADVCGSVSNSWWWFTSEPVFFLKLNWDQ